MMKNTLPYISPTSLSLFEQNVERFYLQYLAIPRTPRFPQTRAMSIGSAFDARVKSALLKDLGLDHDVAGMLNDQVEEQNREWAIKESLVTMGAYRRLGSYDDLLSGLKKSVIAPRFEFKVMFDMEGVPLLGKPDCYFSPGEADIILDWKVNGYCSERGVSAKKGYVKNWGTGDCHPQAIVMPYQGIVINAAHPLETIDKTWATQLCFYAWSLGGGEKTVAQIDQLSCKNGEVLGVYTYRSRISPEFQADLRERIKTMWSILESGWIFRDRSRKESLKRCEELNERAGLEAELSVSEDPTDKFFFENVR